MTEKNFELSKAGLDAWLAAYKQAWEKKDADAAAALFSAGARYYETPYADPFDGPAGIREYWKRVTADQRDIGVEYSVVAVDGNIGVASWSARFRTISGDAAVELSGAFVLEFADSTHCDVLREWWHVR